MRSVVSTDSSAGSAPGTIAPRAAVRAEVGVFKVEDEPDPVAANLGRAHEGQVEQVEDADGVERDDRFAIGAFLRPLDPRHPAVDGHRALRPALEETLRGGPVRRRQRHGGDQTRGREGREPPQAQLCGESLLHQSASKIMR
jgi:hypothetical protein